MADKSKSTNPFYILLIGVAVLFAITACGYGVMTVRLIDPSQSADGPPAGRAFVDFFDRHGLTLLVAELVVLAMATFAAMATDDYWDRRGAARDDCTEKASGDRADSQTKSSA